MAAARNRIDAILVQPQRNAESIGIKIILLLPLLREQLTVETLLTHLETVEYPPELLTLVPVTTDREEIDRTSRQAGANDLVRDLNAGRSSIWCRRQHGRLFGDAKIRAWHSAWAANPSSVVSEIAESASGPTTKQVIERVLGETSSRYRTILINCPEVTGNKATQMNFALSQLVAAGVLSGDVDTYVGVYDADSRPDSRTLLDLAVLASDGRAAAYQQYPVYLQSVFKCDKWMQNEAMLQTSRSVCVEYPRQIRVNTSLRRGDSAGPTFTYCIGHGEFLRADWLLRTGFPEETPIDDLPTGLMLSLARQRIEPLPTFDTCSVPESVWDFVRQTRNWFAAQLVFDVSVKMANAGFGATPNLRRIRGQLEQFFSNAIWALAGPVRLISLALGVWHSAWSGVAALVLAFVVEAAIQWHVTLRVAAQVSEVRPVQAFRISTILRPIIKSIGPCLVLLDWCLRREPDSATYKTERT